MGVWNVMVLWLPLAICHASGYQRFDLPSQDQLPFILLDCALEGAYLVWVVLAIALSRSTTPLPFPLLPWLALLLQERCLQDDSLVPLRPRDEEI